MLLSAAAVGGIGASVYLFVLGPYGGTSHLQRLAHAVGAHRVTRARLTGGFSYAACERVPDDSLVTGLRCATAVPSAWPEFAKIAKAGNEIRAAATSPTDSSNHQHASAAWHIIWGNADAAIDALRTAARLDPKDASVQSDLTAALLERAQQKQDPLSIVEAYTAVDSALALDSLLEEARFNRAVILEWLNLENDAIAAWTSYLEVDSRSRWAEEARARLAELHQAPPSWSAAQSRLKTAIGSDDERTVREIVARFPWRGRDRVRDGLVGWARAYENGDRGADTILRQADGIARALRHATGDALWADATREIIDAGGASERARLTLIARGLADYGKSRAELGRLPLDSTQRRLESARRSLLAGKSVVWHLVDYEFGRVAYQRQTSRGYDEALTHYRHVLATAPGKYRWVRALAMRNIGFIESLRFKYDGAIASFTAAIDEGAALGEPVLELRAPTDVARLVADVRGERAAWKQLYGGFRASPRYPGTTADAQRLFTRAADLSWQRYPVITLLFRAEFVRLARSVGDTLLMATALTREAELSTRAGQSQRALETIEEVREYTRRIADDSIRTEMNTNADLVAGEASLRVQPDSAIRLLRRVAERYQTTQYFIQVVRAKLLLANAFAAAGAMDSARSAFEGALAEKERQRSELGTYDDRARFLDHARPVIDSVLRFLVERSDTLGAFNFFERMRARVLLEQVAHGTPNAGPPPSDMVNTRDLPPGTSVISYAVLDDELVVWLIRRQGISMARVPLDRPLEQLVERFTTLIAAKSRDGEIRSVASHLHELLIAPFADRIEPESRLVVVPDKQLHYVPFAALFDNRRGRFLVESNEIAVAPSVRLFIESSARYKALRATTTPVVLAVGNPSFDRQTYTLPLLPGAEQEAADVAKQYPGSSRLLIGPAATKGAFLQQAKTSNVIHFAGHGLVRPDAPLLSQLVLAPGAGGDSPGALYAKDLYGITLPATRLAILSGCHTGSGEMSATEGTSSLARALFAAGVPAVVASLWAVDDRQTSDFFVLYHRELTRGVDPMVALRSIQRDWIERTRKSEGWGSISTWAAFQLFGATGDGVSSTSAVERAGSRPSKISRGLEAARRRSDL